jgi:hypothetical protein
MRSDLGVGMPTGYSGGEARYLRRRGCLIGSAGEPAPRLREHWFEALREAHMAIPWPPHLPTGEIAPLAGLISPRLAAIVRLPPIGGPAPTEK